MIRDVELLEYLPEFVREYREMRYLMLAENPEIQTLEDATEVVKNNQFILTCSEKWIAKYEKLVAIIQDPGSSLEDRQRRVLEKWGTAVPYNYARFLKKLDALCWNEGYAIQPNFDAYEIEILVSLVEKGQIRDLEWLCETYIPANMDVKLINKISMYPEDTAWMNGVMSLCLIIDTEE